MNFQNCQKNETTKNTQDTKNLSELSALSGLPRGWSWVKLGDVVASLESGKRPKGGVKNILSGIPSIGAEHLSDDGKFDFSKIRFVPEDFAKSMNKGWIKNEDIIVVKDGATTAKTSFVSENFPFKNAVINEHVFICRVKKEINPKWVFFNLWSEQGRKKILLDFRGAAQGGISSNFINKVEIPLPPLSEQKKIVEKIEELFSQLDSGVVALKKAKEQIRLYRQSVLAAAFSGRLTIKNTQNTENLSELSALSGLPNGWKWVKLGEVTQINPKLPYEEIDENILVSFLPMKQVEELTGKFDLSMVKKYSEVKKGFTPFTNGDVIFAKITPCMENGKIAVMNNLKNKIGFGSTEFHVFRVNNELFNQYLFYFLIQDLFRAKAQHSMTGAVGQKRVPKRFLEEFVFPLPPFREQLQIVSEIEKRFSQADNLEKAIDESLAKAESLRQSILKQAFEGKLV